MAQAGADPDVLRGAGDPAQLQALEKLDQPGGIVLALYPAERGLARSAGRVPVTVVAAELHDARRHLARLCRALAADACEMLIALEDEAVGAGLTAPVKVWARRGARGGAELPPARSRWVAQLAQRAAERSCAALRADVVARDRQLDDLLAFSGKRE